MTVLLQEVFEKASALPEEQQDVLAREFLQEIEWENRWDKTLEKSQNTLDKMTEKAMRAYESGETEEMGFDEL